jgi:hypothetical protein
MQVKTVLNKVVAIGSRWQVEGLIRRDIIFLSTSVSIREDKSIVPLCSRLGHISSKLSSGLA